MHIECECRILEINKEEFIRKLEKLGAVKVGEYFQKRFVYDFNPIVSNKWIRLRTNGEKTTLTIKELVDKTIIGTKELEIEVSDFDDANKILNELGYTARNYQENKRITYILDDIEVDIDTWPLIPTYVEIEGKNRECIDDLIKKLSICKKNITSLDVTSIYNEIYNIDILKIKELRFWYESMLEFDK